MSWKVGDWWRPGDRTTSEVAFKNPDPAKAAAIVKATTARAGVGQTQTNATAAAAQPKPTDAPQQQPQRPDRGAPQTTPADETPARLPAEAAAVPTGRSLQPAA